MSDNVKTLNAVEQLQIAQAKIAELEKELKFWKSTRRESNNQIKAEGIKEMLAVISVIKFDPRLDYSYVDRKDAKKYADKLEKSDE